MHSQAKFKTREAYFEWRTYWKRQYEGCAKEIRYYKKCIKSGTYNDCITPLLRQRQMVARNLMLARENVEGSYRLRQMMETMPNLVVRNVGDGMVEVFEGVVEAIDEQQN